MFQALVEQGATPFDQFFWKQIDLSRAFGQFSVYWYMMIQISFVKVCLLLTQIPYTYNHDKTQVRITFFTQYWYSKAW